MQAGVWHRAGSVLQQHQEAALRLRLGQQGGGGRSLTDCMRAAEDKRPCGGGAKQNRGEQ